MTMALSLAAALAVARKRAILMKALSTSARARRSRLLPVPEGSFV